MADTPHERLAAAARAAVDRLFRRAKIRLGVGNTDSRDKRIAVSVDPDLTLPGLYEVAAREHGLPPRPGAQDEVRRSAAGFLEAQAEAAKAAVGRVVHHMTREEITPETRKELEEVLGTILERAGDAVERIVDTEATAVRNLSGVEAFGVLNAAVGVDDPIVFFVVTHRNTCEECYSVHTTDGTTPRLWRLSEVSRAYHVRGEDRPSVLGLHPHCQCSMTTLMPGWGFDASGKVKYIAPGHDALAVQRG